AASATDIGDPSQLPSMRGVLLGVSAVVAGLGGLVYAGFRLWWAARNRPRLSDAALRELAGRATSTTPPLSDAQRAALNNEFHQKFRPRGDGAPDADASRDTRSGHTPGEVELNGAVPQLVAAAVTGTVALLGVRGLLTRLRTGAPLTRTDLGLLAGSAVAAATTALLLPLPAALGYVAFAVRGWFSVLNKWAPTPAWTRLLASSLALTWLTNLNLHTHAIPTAAGILLAVNAIITIADLAFLTRDYTGALNSWAGAPKPTTPTDPTDPDPLRTRLADTITNIVRWIGFPTITTAAALISIHLFTTGDYPPAIAISIATAGFAYLAWHNIATGLNRRHITPHAGPVALTLFTAVTAFALISLAPFPAYLAATTSALTVLTFTLWLANHLTTTTTPDTGPPAHDKLINLPLAALALTAAPIGYALHFLGTGLPLAASVTTTIWGITAALLWTINRPTPPTTHTPTHTDETPTDNHTSTTDSIDPLIGGNHDPMYGPGLTHTDNPLSGATTPTDVTKSSVDSAEQRRRSGEVDPLVAARELSGGRDGDRADDRDRLLPDSTELLRMLGLAPREHESADRRLPTSRDVVDMLRDTGEEDVELGGVTPVSTASPGVVELGTARDLNGSVPDVVVSAGQVPLNGVVPGLVSIVGQTLVVGVAVGAGRWFFRTPTDEFGRTIRPSPAARTATSIKHAWGWIRGPDSRDWLRDAWKSLRSPIGLASAGTVVWLTAAYFAIGQLSLPAWLGMIDFLVVGLINQLRSMPSVMGSHLLKPAPGEKVGRWTWVLNTFAPLAQLMNVYLLTLAMPSLDGVDWWVNAAFVVANGAFALNGIPGAIATWFKRANPMRFTEQGKKLSVVLSVVGFIGALASIPLMTIQLTEPAYYLVPTQLVLILSTYVSWTGEATFNLFHIYKSARNPEHRTPETRGRYWGASSGLALILYGFVYLLPSTSVLTASAAALTAVSAQILWLIKHHGPPPSEAPGGETSDPLNYGGRQPRNLWAIEAQLVQLLNWTDALTGARAVAEFSLLPRRWVARSGVNGVRVNNEYSSTLRGMSELPVHGRLLGHSLFAGWDGWLYTDTGGFARLTELRRTNPKDFRAVMRHELTHIAHPNWSEWQVQEAAPQPTGLGSLLHGTRRINERVGHYRFRGLTHPYGDVIQAPEFGSTPVPGLNSLARLLVSRNHSGELLGAGTLIWALDQYGYILTHHNLIKDATAIRIKLAGRHWNGEPLPELPDQDSGLRIVRIDRNEHPDAVLQPLQRSHGRTAFARPVAVLSFSRSDDLAPAHGITYHAGFILDRDRNPMVTAGWALSRNPSTTTRSLEEPTDLAIARNPFLGFSRGGVIGAPLVVTMIGPNGGAHQSLVGVAKGTGSDHPYPDSGEYVDALIAVGVQAIDKFLDDQRAAGLDTTPTGDTTSTGVTRSSGDSAEQRRRSGAVDPLIALDPAFGPGTRELSGRVDHAQPDSVTPLNGAVAPGNQHPLVQRVVKELRDQGVEWMPLGELTERLNTDRGDLARRLLGVRRGALVRAIDRSTSLISAERGGQPVVIAVPHEVVDNGLVLSASGLLELPGVHPVGGRLVVGAAHGGPRFSDDPRAVGWAGLWDVLAGLPSLSGQETHIEDAEQRRERISELVTLLREGWPARGRWETEGALQVHRVHYDRPIGVLPGDGRPATRLDIVTARLSPGLSMLRNMYPVGSDTRPFYGRDDLYTATGQARPALRAQLVNEIAIVELLTGLPSDGGAKFATLTDLAARLGRSREALFQAAVNSSRLFIEADLTPSSIVLTPEGGIEVGVSPRLFTEPHTTGTTETLIALAPGGIDATVSTTIEHGVQVILWDRTTDRRLRITRPHTLVGRDPNATVRLAEGPPVHAVLVVATDTDGLHLDLVDLSAEHRILELADGDQVRMGGHLYQLSITRPSPELSAGSQLPDSRELGGSVPEGESPLTAAGRGSVHGGGGDSVSPAGRVRELGGIGATSLAAGIGTVNGETSIGQARGPPAPSKATTSSGTSRGTPSGHTPGAIAPANSTGHHTAMPDVLDRTGAIVLSGSSVGLRGIQLSGRPLDRVQVGRVGQALNRNQVSELTDLRSLARWWRELESGLPLPDGVQSLRQVDSRGWPDEVLAVEQDGHGTLPRAVAEELRQLLSPRERAAFFSELFNPTGRRLPSLAAITVSRAFDLLYTSGRGIGPRTLARRLGLSALGMSTGRLFDDLRTSPWTNSLLLGRRPLPPPIIAGAVDYLGNDRFSLRIDAAEVAKTDPPSAYFDEVWVENYTRFALDTLPAVVNALLLDGRLHIAFSGGATLGVVEQAARTLTELGMDVTRAASTGIEAEKRRVAEPGRFATAYRDGADQRHSHRRELLAIPDASSWDLAAVATRAGRDYQLAEAFDIRANATTDLNGSTPLDVVAGIVFSGVGSGWESLLDWSPLMPAALSSAVVGGWIASGLIKRVRQSAQVASARVGVLAGIKDGFAADAVARVQRRIEANAPALSQADSVLRAAEAVRDHAVSVGAARSAQWSETRRQWAAAWESRITPLDPELRGLFARLVAVVEPGRLDAVLVKVGNRVANSSGLDVPVDVLSGIAATFPGWHRHVTAGRTGTVPLEADNSELVQGIERELAQALVGLAHAGAGLAPLRALHQAKTADYLAAEQARRDVADAWAALLGAGEAAKVPQAEFDDAYREFTTIRRTARDLAALVDPDTRNSLDWTDHDRIPTHAVAEPQPIADRAHREARTGLPGLLSRAGELFDNTHTLPQLWHQGTPGRILLATLTAGAATFTALFATAVTAAVTATAIGLSAALLTTRLGPRLTTHAPTTTTKTNAPGPGYVDPEYGHDNTVTSPAPAALPGTSPSAASTPTRHGAGVDPRISGRSAAVELSGSAPRGVRLHRVTGLRHIRTLRSDLDNGRDKVMQMRDDTGQLKVVKRRGSENWRVSSLWSVNGAIQAELQGGLTHQPVLATAGESVRAKRLRGWLPGSREVISRGELFELSSYLRGAPLGLGRISPVRLADVYDWMATELVLHASLGNYDAATIGNEIIVSLGNEYDEYNYLKYSTDFDVASRYLRPDSTLPMILIELLHQSPEIYGMSTVEELRQQLGQFVLAGDARLVWLPDRQSQLILEKDLEWADTAARSGKLGTDLLHHHAGAREKASEWSGLGSLDRRAFHLDQARQRAERAQSRAVHPVGAADTVSDLLQQIEDGWDTYVHSEDFRSTPENELWNVSLVHPGSPARPLSGVTAASTSAPAETPATPGTAPIRAPAGDAVNLSGSVPGLRGIQLSGLPLGQLELWRLGKALAASRGFETTDSRLFVRWWRESGTSAPLPRMQSVRRHEELAVPVGVLLAEHGGHVELPRVVERELEQLLSPGELAALFAEAFNPTGRPLPFLTAVIASRAFDELYRRGRGLGPHALSRRLGLSPLGLSTTALREALKTAPWVTAWWLNAGLLASPIVEGVVEYVGGDRYRLSLDAAKTPKAGPPSAYFDEVRVANYTSFARDTLADAVAALLRGGQLHISFAEGIGPVEAQREADQVREVLGRLGMDVTRADPIGVDGRKREVVEPGEFATAYREGARHRRTQVPYLRALSDTTDWNLSAVAGRVGYDHRLADAYTERAGALAYPATALSGDTPHAGTDPAADLREVQRERLQTRSLLRQVSVIVFVFTASQVALGWIAGSTAVYVDAVDNLFGLVPVLLSVATVRVAWQNLDRVAVRTVAVGMMSVGSALDLSTFFRSAEQASTLHASLTVVAGGLNLAGAILVGLAYLRGTPPAAPADMAVGTWARVRPGTRAAADLAKTTDPDEAESKGETSTAEAGSTQAIADAINSATVVGSGLWPLLGVPLAAFADIVATRVGSSVLTLMGMGVYSGREWNLLTAVKHPIVTLRKIGYSIRFFVTNVVTTALHPKTLWDNTVAGIRRIHAEWPLYSVFRQREAVALSIAELTASGIPPKRLAKALAQVDAGSERFVRVGDLIVDRIAVGQDPRGMTLAQMERARWRLTHDEARRGHKLSSLAGLAGVGEETLAGYVYLDPDYIDPLRSPHAGTARTATAGDAAAPLSGTPPSVGSQSSASRTLDGETLPDGPSRAMRPLDYRRMAEGGALALAEGFHTEETQVVDEMASRLSDPATWSLVVVGGAAVGHLTEVAARFGGFVVIDPLAPDLLDAQGAGRSPTVIRKPFDKVDSTELPATPTLWLFTFNVYPYLDHPLSTWRGLAADGDIAVITTWASGEQAKATRAAYLRHVFPEHARREQSAASSVEPARVREDLDTAELAARIEYLPGTMVDTVVLHRSLNPLSVDLSTPAGATAAPASRSSGDVAELSGSSPPVVWAFGGSSQQGQRTLPAPVMRTLWADGARLPKSAIRLTGYSQERAERVRVVNRGRLRDAGIADSLTDALFGFSFTGIAGDGLTGLVAEPLWRAIALANAEMLDIAWLDSALGLLERRLAGAPDGQNTAVALDRELAAAWQRAVAVNSGLSRSALESKARNLAEQFEARAGWSAEPVDTAVWLITAWNLRTRARRLPAHEPVRATVLEAVDDDLIAKLGKLLERNSNGLPLSLPVPDRLAAHTRWNPEDQRALDALIVAAEELAAAGLRVTFDNYQEWAARMRAEDAKSWYPSPQSLNNRWGPWPALRALAAIPDSATRLATARQLLSRTRDQRADWAAGYWADPAAASRTPVPSARPAAPTPVRLPSGRDTTAMLHALVDRLTSSSGYTPAELADFAAIAWVDIEDAAHGAAQHRRAFTRLTYDSWRASHPNVRIPWGSSLEGRFGDWPTIAEVARIADPTERAQRVLQIVAGRAAQRVPTVPRPRPAPSEPGPTIQRDTVDTAPELQRTWRRWQDFSPIERELVRGQVNPDHVRIAPIRALRASGHTDLRYGIAVVDRGSIVLAAEPLRWVAALTVSNTLPSTWLAEMLDELRGGGTSQLTESTLTQRLRKARADVAERIPAAPPWAQAQRLTTAVARLAPLGSYTPAARTASLLAEAMLSRVSDQDRRAEYERLIDQLWDYLDNSGWHRFPAAGPAENRIAPLNGETPDEPSKVGSARREMPTGRTLLAGLGLAVLGLLTAPDIAHAAPHTDALLATATDPGNSSWLTGLWDWIQYGGDPSQYSSMGGVLLRILAVIAPPAVLGFVGWEIWSTKFSTRRGSLDYLTFAQLRNRNLIHAHDDLITPRFQGIGPLFLGLELEFRFPIRKLVRNVEAAVQHLGGVGYVKEDPSITPGIEVITHPLSYARMMEAFPWAMLDVLKRGGASVRKTGMHVHVSRAAFSSAEHSYRWLRFWYSNADQIRKLARRESDEWARFRSPDPSTLRQYSQGAKGWTRHEAINTKNDDTFEVRVFASSLDPQEIQAAFGLVAATVEYTRTLNATDDMPDNVWDWSRFVTWLEDHPEYAPLQREIRKRLAGQDQSTRRDTTTPTPHSAAGDTPLNGSTPTRYRQIRDDSTQLPARVRSMLPSVVLVHTFDAEDKDGYQSTGVVVEPDTVLALPWLRPSGRILVQSRGSDEIVPAGVAINDPVSGLTVLTAETAARPVDFVPADELERELERGGDTWVLGYDERGILNAWQARVTAIGELTIQTGDSARQVDAVTVDTPAPMVGNRGAPVVRDDGLIIGSVLGESHNGLHVITVESLATLMAAEAKGAATRRAADPGRPATAANPAPAGRRSMPHRYLPRPIQVVVRAEPGIGAAGSTDATPTATASTVSDRGVPTSDTAGGGRQAVNPSPGNKDPPSSRFRRVFGRFLGGTLAIAAGLAIAHGGPESSTAIPAALTTAPGTLWSSQEIAVPATVEPTTTDLSDPYLADKTGHEPTSLVGPQSRTGSTPLGGNAPTAGPGIDAAGDLATVTVRGSFQDDELDQLGPEVINSFVTHARRLVAKLPQIVADLVRANRDIAANELRVLLHTQGLYLSDTYLAQLVADANLTSATSLDSPRASLSTLAERLAGPGAAASVQAGAKVLVAHALTEDYVPGLSQLRGMSLTRFDALLTTLGITDRERAAVHALLDALPDGAPLSGDTPVPPLDGGVVRPATTGLSGQTPRTLDGETPRSGTSPDAGTRVRTLSGGAVPIAAGGVVRALGEGWFRFLDHMGMSGPRLPSTRVDVRFIQSQVRARARAREVVAAAATVLAAARAEFTARDGWVGGLAAGLAGLGSTPGEISQGLAAGLELPAEVVADRLGRSAAKAAVDALVGLPTQVAAAVHSERMLSRVGLHTHVEAHDAVLAAARSATAESAARLAAAEARYGRAVEAARSLGAVEFAAGQAEPAAPQVRSGRRFGLELWYELRLYFSFVQRAIDAGADHQFGSERGQEVTSEVQGFPHLRLLRPPDLQKYREQKAARKAARAIRALSKSSLQTNPHTLRGVLPRTWRWADLANAWTRFKAWVWSRWWEPAGQFALLVIEVASAKVTILDGPHGWLPKIEAKASVAISGGPGEDSLRRPAEKIRSSWIWGWFLYPRSALSFTWPWIRIDAIFFPWWFTGYNVVPMVPTPHLGGGWHPWARTVNWALAHDGTLWVQNLFRAFLYFQIGIGIGLPGMDGNLLELRISIVKAVVVWKGVAHEFHFIEGPSRQVGRIVRGLGRQLAPLTPTSLLSFLREAHTRFRIRAEARHWIELAGARNRIRAANDYLQKEAAWLKQELQRVFELQLATSRPESTYWTKQGLLPLVRFTLGSPSLAARAASEGRRLRSNLSRINSSIDTNNKLINQIEEELHELNPTGVTPLLRAPLNGDSSTFAASGVRPLSGSGSTVPHTAISDGVDHAGVVAPLVGAKTANAPPGLGPVSHSGQPLSLGQRLAEVYRRLDLLPAATSADQAVTQLNDTLTAVEDEYSGVPANPNPGLKFDGRMYPPREDFMTRTLEGAITATTKGNVIHASPNGALRIPSRRTGEAVYRRDGATPVSSAAGEAVLSPDENDGPTRDDYTPSEVKLNGTVPQLLTAAVTGTVALLGARGLITRVRTGAPLTRTDVHDGPVETTPLAGDAAMEPLVGATEANTPPGSVDSSDTKPAADIDVDAVVAGLREAQRERLQTRSLLRAVSVVVFAFTASQVVLGVIAGATAVYVDAVDNLFGLGPVLLSVLAARVAWQKLDKVAVRLVAAGMISVGSSLFLSTFFKPAEVASTWHASLTVAAGGLNLAGAILVGLIYIRGTPPTAPAGMPAGTWARTRPGTRASVDRADTTTTAASSTSPTTTPSGSAGARIGRRISARIGQWVMKVGAPWRAGASVDSAKTADEEGETSAAEAGSTQVIADAINSGTVIGSGLWPLLGVPLAAFADIVATRFGSGVLTLMGMGVYAGREWNLSTVFKHPITTLGKIVYSIRFFVTNVVTTALHPKTLLDNTVAGIRRVRAEWPLYSVFAAREAVALSVAELAASGIDPERLAKALAQVDAGSERFVRVGNLIVNQIAVGKDPRGLTLAQLEDARWRLARDEVARGHKPVVVAGLAGVRRTTLDRWLQAPDPDYADPLTDPATHIQLSGEVPLTGDAVNASVNDRFFGAGADEVSPPVVAARGRSPPLRTATTDTGATSPGRIAATVFAGFGLVALGLLAVPDVAHAATHADALLVSAASATDIG
ncbi:hypothetical protein, partial [Pseudonocardia spinosispora]|uniref:hypothetical protein n=1 Tax=Pseudonocardia spinosispora TaxID=103441 RepID=UPI0005606EFE